MFVSWCLSTEQTPEDGVLWNENACYSFWNHLEKPLMLHLRMLSLNGAMHIVDWMKIVLIPLLWEKY